MPRLRQHQHSVDAIPPEQPTTSGSARTSDLGARQRLTIPSQLRTFHDNSLPKIDRIDTGRIDGGDGSFAQVVSPISGLPEIVASVELGSGEIGSSPDAASIGSNGGRSAIVVCAQRDDTQVGSSLLFTNTADQMAGSPKSYTAISAKRYRTRAFELASGKMLGEDVIQAEVATCQNGYRKVDVADVAAEAARLRAESRSVWDTNVDVTDEQITSWTVAHLQGGTYH